MMNGERHLKIRRGSMLGNEYQVDSVLGEGGFGVVAKCRNIHTNEYSAVKVTKNSLDTFHQAREEIANLKRLQSLDPDKSHIVKYNGFFFDKSSICLNFELLDLSLNDYIRERRDENIPMMEIRCVLKQMATALAHLSAEGMVHADIKPDNVMVVDCHEKPLRVKLIDFGLACPASDCLSGVYVGTTGYMSPEVYLGCQFNEAVDIWSLGLVAAEMATGRPLYPGKMDYDVLKYIIETQGQLPDSLLDRGQNTAEYFYYQDDGPTRWRFKTPEEVEEEYGHEYWDSRYFFFESLDDLEGLLDDSRGPSREHGQFVDLIKRMLHLDPEQRITALEVLQHPFLVYSFPHSSSNEVCINMAGIDEVTPTDLQQPSCETGEPPHVILEIEPEGQNEKEEMQPVNKAFMGRMGCLMTWMKETFFSHYLWMQRKDTQKHQLGSEALQVSENLYQDKCPHVCIVMEEDVDDVEPERTDESVGWFRRVMGFKRRAPHVSESLPRDEGPHVRIVIEEDVDELLPKRTDESTGWFRRVMGFKQTLRSYFF